MTAQSHMAGKWLDQDSDPGLYFKSSGPSLMKQERGVAKVPTA